MKKGLSLLLILFVTASLSFATPILTGDGQGGFGDFGFFGSTGTIYDFEMKASADGSDINLTSTSVSAGNSLMFTYTFTAISDISDINVFSFLDADIDEGYGDWTNEMGESFESTGGADSWEIDEPDQVFGDIYENYTYGTLDEGVFESLYLPTTITINQDDVAMALGFSVGALTAGSTLSLELMISEESLSTTEWGTILHQWDVDDPTGDQLYFAGKYSVSSPEPPPNNVPEPGAFSLIFVGLVVLAATRRKNKN